MVVVRAWVGSLTVPHHRQSLVVMHMFMVMAGRRRDGGVQGGAAGVLLVAGGAVGVGALGATFPITYIDIFVIYQTFSLVGRVD